MVGVFLGVIATLASRWERSRHAMDDYTGSLSLQSTASRSPALCRPRSWASAASCCPVHVRGQRCRTFENIVLFSGYWAAPYVAIVLIEWWLRKGKVNVGSLLHLRDLESGWEGLVALVVGFGAAVPFMDATIFVGPVSEGPLHGGDLAYEVGFVVAGIVYYTLRTLTGGWASAGATTGQPVVAAAAAGPVTTSADVPPAESAGQA